MFLNNDDSLIVKYCVESAIVEETKTHCKQQLLRHEWLVSLFFSVVITIIVWLSMASQQMTLPINFVA